jgi:hypothetical protein
VVTWTAALWVRTAFLGIGIFLPAVSVILASLYRLAADFFLFRRHSSLLLMAMSSLWNVISFLLSATSSPWTGIAFHAATSTWRNCASSRCQVGVVPGTLGTTTCHVLEEQAL